MKRATKGQGLSLNTIVIAILVLIVLVVIVLIMTGKLRETSKGLQEAERPYASGERCAVPGTLRTCRTSEDCADRSGINYGQLDCASQICCSS